MSQGLTIVEIGDGLVAAATARGPDGPIQGATATLPADFPTLEVGDRGKALQKALQDCGVTGKKYALVLPRRQALLREFNLPPGEPEEHQQMIRFQLERELPVPRPDPAWLAACQPGRQTPLPTRRGGGRAKSHPHSREQRFRRFWKRCEIDLTTCVSSHLRCGEHPGGCGMGFAMP